MTSKVLCYWPVKYRENARRCLTTWLIGGPLAIQPAAEWGGRYRDARSNLDQVLTYETLEIDQLVYESFQVSSPNGCLAVHGMFMQVPLSNDTAMDPSELGNKFTYNFEANFALYFNV
jgi:hypothetical protein